MAAPGISYLPDAGSWLLVGVCSNLVDLVRSDRTDLCGTHHWIRILVLYSVVFFVSLLFFVSPVTLPGTHAWRSAITWGKPAFLCPVFLWVFLLAFLAFSETLLLALFQAFCLGLFWAFFAFCCFLLVHILYLLVEFFSWLNCWFSLFVGTNSCQICIILLSYFTICINNLSIC